MKKSEHPRPDPRLKPIHPKKLFPSLLFAFFATAALSAAPARPNTLSIIGDDLSNELGCYGHPTARAPNLDRFAAGGLRYTRFYTTAPVCSASRSAFMTGMYARTLHAENDRTAAAGRPWVVCNDEQNPAGLGVPPDPSYHRFADNAKNGKTVGYDLHDIREFTLWGTLMAGGAGGEYYFG